jgi:type II secretory pathway component PulF
MAGLRVERLERVDSADGRMSEREAADFAQHLARLSEAGLPLPEGLRALGGELAVGSLQRVLNAVSDQLEAGHSLDEAIAAQGDRFPAHLKYLVLAGLKTGSLGEILEQYAHYSHTSGALRRKMWLSLVYPIMLMCALALLMVFMAHMVTSFETIFKDFGIALPSLTMFLISASHAVMWAGGWGCTLTLFGFVLVALIGVSIRSRGSGRTLIARLPLLGPLLRWLSLVEFTHFLALLLECETPLPAALTLSAGSLRDQNLAWSCRTLCEEVSRGRSLGEAMIHVRGFPPGLARIVEWAEGGESLPSALHLAGDMYEARARAQATFVGIACTMMAVVFVVWGIGMSVVGLFYPMIVLVNRLAL